MKGKGSCDLLINQIAHRIINISKANLGFTPFT